MHQAAFLLDAPTAVTAARDEGPPTSQHPVAILGKFKDPRYGRFAITRADYAGWQRNLHGIQQGRIPIDYDHAPDTGGSSEAAGWITRLDLARGTDLDMPGVIGDAEYVIATIEWTPAGASAVTDRVYQFVSPTFGPGRDEQGNPTGPTLHGVALTNRPFLRSGMPAISLTAATGAPFAVVEGVGDTEDVPELNTLRVALGMDDTTSDGDVVAAAVTRLTAPAPTPPVPDRVTLRDQAAAEGLVMLDQAEHAALKQAADSGAAASQALHAQRFTLAVRDARRAGRLDTNTDTEERWRKLYDLDPDTTVQMLSDLPQVVQTEPRSGGNPGEPEAAPAGVHVGSWMLDQRARAIIAKAAADGRTLAYTDALQHAMTEQEAA